MSIDWFRYYHADLHNADIQLLEPIMFKHWVNLNCLASAQKVRGVLPANKQIAFNLKLDVAEVGVILQKLVEAGLLECLESGAYRIYDWDRKQYASDSSTQRVKEYRERQKAERFTPPDAETLPKQACNDDETLHGTDTQHSGNVVDTDTDTEKESPHSPPEVGTPRKRSRARFKPPTEEEVLSFFESEGGTEIEAHRFINHYQGNGWKVGKVGMADWKATARNWISGRFVGGSNRSPAQPALSTSWAGLSDEEKGRKYQEVLNGVN